MGYTPQGGLVVKYHSFSLPATAAHLSCNRNPWPKGYNLDVLPLQVEKRNGNGNPIPLVALGVCRPAGHVMLSKL